MKKAYLIILFFLCVCYTSCRKEPIEVERSTIVVLFENDVHCAIDGYTRLAGLRDAIYDTAYVAVVSSGDFVQGAIWCHLSRAICHRHHEHRRI